MTNDESNRITKLTKNQNTRRKGILLILWNIGSDTIKQAEIKKKFKLLETKLYSRNLIKGIKTWAARL